jgi:hypothetical protein
MRIYRADHLSWEGLTIRLGKRGHVLAYVIPDPDWPNMYRVQMPGRDLSDTVNLSRAKDAAVCLALASVNVAKEAA